jgi:hypothetical protein
MPGIFYAAVEDDPLTSGKRSRVFSALRCGTIQGHDGKRRRLAFIGDKAYCSACDSLGQITYGASVGEKHRLKDSGNGGRRQAVGGDIVICKCATPPRIIATYGTSWRITDMGSADEQTVRGSTRPVQVNHDQQFTLTDASGSALANTFYTVRLPTGNLTHGTTDALGRTTRYTTDGAQRITIYLGHREQ